MKSLLGGRLFIVWELDYGGWFYFVFFSRGCVYRAIWGFYRFAYVYNGFESAVIVGFGGINKF